MKLTTLLIGCLLSPAFLQAQDTEKKPTFDPAPSGMDKYGKLLEKDPFNFDVPPPPPDAPTPPMEGWLLAGITKTEEYQTAILVNLKSSERLRLNHYRTPPSKRANTTIHGGDKYELVSIDFEDGDPKLKNASAVITKNGERAKVEYSDEILKLKPAAAPAGPGGAAKGPVPPGGAPSPMVRPAQPGAAPAAGGSSNAELIKMLQKQRGEHAAGTPGAPTAGGTTPAGTSSNPTQPSAAPPQPRRRVVLPTEAAGAAPAAPAATPAPPAPVPGN